MLHTSRLPKLLVILVAGFLATLIICAVGSIPHCYGCFILLAPGLLVGLLIAPEGVHADHLYAGLIVAGVINVIVLGYLTHYFLQRFGSPLVQAKEEECSTLSILR